MYIKLLFVNLNFGRHDLTFGPETVFVSQKILFINFVQVYRQESISRKQFIADTFIATKI